MLRTLKIENFRTFPRFSMEGLGRINLCVGTNNCGKTSVLEAISILTARGRPEVVWQVLSRRGERWYDDRGPGRIEVDVCHLFYGHELDPNAAFAITARSDSGAQSVQATLVERGPEATDAQERISSTQASLFEPGESEISVPGRLALRLQWDGPTPLEQQLTISRRGGITSEALERPGRRREDDAPPARFITTEALSRDEVVALFEAIVLTPEEENVIEALKTIEPAIERIAPIGTDRRRYFVADRGGIVVKLANSKQRIPIGSMGDGIWRMLGIAVSLAKARGGILLVDEIDTGLHYTVMADMWKLVRDTAARLDVQVFATTHSRDCYESLAAISRSDVGTNGDVSIQRIERGKSSSISFSERDIVIAADRGIEVR
ncbi:AAA family ATPase [Sorangium sp. So ce128]|uniref:AAA family ATPase n=1 Tax=Sorangium sp. So ce128 TaxID=3133281 RepID=UPI003F5DB1B1